MGNHYLDGANHEGEGAMRGTGSTGREEGKVGGIEEGGVGGGVIEGGKE